MSIRMREALLRMVTVLGVAVASSTALHAQPRTVEGRVMHPQRERGDSSSVGPARNAWVTLHRVGKDVAGPIDSVRTDANGRYRFQWTLSGAPDAVYFASVSWDGIAYFTPPLRSAATSGDDAEITVFDTTSRVFPLTVRGRHLIVGAADSTDQRAVIEVFELSNDSVRALVSRDDQAPAPVWSVAVPQAAKEAHAGEGEISPEAFRFAPGRVSIYAPIAPGVKQISFSYHVPAANFPLAFTAERGAVVFEVLLEEPQGTVTGEGFSGVAPVSIEGRNFRRFLAQDVKPNARLIVELPTTRMPGRNLYIAGLLVGVGFLMLLVLSRAMGRRNTASSTETLAAHLGGGSRTAGAPLHERLAHEIAALDAVYAKQSSPSDSMRATYEARRAELVNALSDALAEVPASR